jgi:hypothetical protein
MAASLQVLFISLVSLSAPTMSVTTDKNDIAGVWKTEEKDKDVEFEIYLANDYKFYGKVVKNTKTPGNNGRIALKELVYNERERTYTGTMQPPDATIELNVSVTLESKNRLKIVARKLLMRKTMYLKRLR